MLAVPTSFRLRTIAALACLTVVLVAAACDSGPTATPATPPSSHGGPVRNQPSLIDALRASGLSVNPVAKLQQPVLSGSGETVQVNSETIQVYEYPNEKAAQDDAAKVQPNGTVPGVSVNWPGPPHFYRKEGLIVIYPGNDQTVLTALEAALGKPFAVGP